MKSQKSLYPLKRQIEKKISKMSLIHSIFLLFNLNRFFFNGFESKARLIVLRLFLISLVLASGSACSFFRSEVVLYCGKYTASQLQVANEKPIWKEDPGTCKIAHTNWSIPGTKQQGVKVAEELAIAAFAQEISGAEITVKSQLHTNAQVTSFGKHTNEENRYVRSSEISIKGKKVVVKTAIRAQWFAGYQVWVLVEKIEQ